MGQRAFGQIGGIIERRTTGDHRTGGAYDLADQRRRLRRRRRDHLRMLTQTETE